MRYFQEPGSETETSMWTSKVASDVESISNCLHLLSRLLKDIVLMATTTSRKHRQRKKNSEPYSI